MLRGEAEFQRQKVLNRAAGNWNKEFLRTTDKEWNGTNPETSSMHRG